jgi:hypothetical protein
MEELTPTRPSAWYAGAQEEIALRRLSTTACAIGFAVSAALLLGSVLGARSFVRAAEDRTVERVRRALQDYAGDQPVSTDAARRFLLALPAAEGDFTPADRDQMRDLVRALGERDPSPSSDRTLPSAQTTEDGPGPSAATAYKSRSLTLILELRLACAACTLLFGLACWLFSGSPSTADNQMLAAKIAACGATLIGSGYSAVWLGLGPASHDFAIPAIVAATFIVLTLMTDVLFNDSRVMRAALDFSRFWP